jgi:hypothetical protein
LFARFVGCSIAYVQFVGYERSRRSARHARLTVPGVAAVCFTSAPLTQLSSAPKKEKGKRENRSGSNDRFGDECLYSASSLHLHLREPSSAWYSSEEGTAHLFFFVGNEAYAQM